ncbi:MAG: response regulator [Lachnospiraceae bacterium]|nr:response regulator [Lachnospiraceae bacterium]
MADISLIETIHRLYISLTALGFNILLSVMLVAFDQGERDRNRSFVQLCLVVLGGNVTTCICTVLRRTIEVASPPFVAYFAYLLMCLVNVFVTYYFARYIESYFYDENSSQKLIRRINFGLVISICAAAVVFYVIKLPELLNMNDTAEADFGGWVRVLFGYALELYFLIYTAAVFLIHRQKLDRRAFNTGVVAMSATVIGVVFQLFFPGVLVNYVGAVMGLYLFYIGVETPDYRKLRQTLEDLREAREAADRANKSKSYFLANMSHEIRTPINAVMGMNEMIIRESTDENITNYAHNVENSARNLLSIINDILDFSKIEAGKLEIINAPYSLGVLLNETVNMVEFRSKSKGLKLDVFVEQNLPDMLYGDEVRIRQILTNLLTNAIKYTDEGTVTLTVEGDRKQDNEEVLELRLAVIDTGIGIRESDLDKLFSQFERVDLIHNKTIEGTGLGLAITHDLVSEMGGTIKVESVYGKGSAFRVVLPQEIKGNELIGDFHDRFRRDNPIDPDEEFTAPEARILVVDDTRINLMVTQALLKKTEIRVDTAMSGREGISKSLDGKYDIILMDQRMPQLDGTQAMKMIRSREENPNAHTIIICLTADALSGARERYLAEGFDDYLTKPIEGNSLEKMCRKYLPKEKVAVKR